MSDEVTSMFGQIDEIRVSLSVEGQGDKAWKVVSFHGVDTISELSSFAVVLLTSAETAEALDDLLGREAHFVVSRATPDAPTHDFRGIVEEVFPGGVAVGKNLRHTTVRLVPRLSELFHTQGCRVFQNVTVVDIARSLFKLWQIELEARLHPEPLVREYCTQVNESDYHFVARILAEEGIHYYIEHGPEKSVVVLVNQPRGYDPIVGEATLPFRDAGGALTVDHVKSIRRERRVRVGSVAHRDYNFVKPGREMTSREETPMPDAPAMLGAREFYEYPGQYVDPDEESAGVAAEVQRPTRSGMVRARMRLEEKRSSALTFTLTSTSLRLRVGRVFEIADHADAQFNRKYLVTDVVFGGQGGGNVALERGDRIAASAIELRVTAVPAETRIRPVVKPKPKAHLRTALVVGPKADEPNVDEYGRIRIQFAWDREGQHDDKSSCWVRMATPVAHHNQGSYTAHRVGAEVLVDFLDGDVDRPVVVSALYNGDNRQPQALPADATRAVLYRGLSVPGNKGKNEISCEDRAGKEEIFLHAQRDLNETILRSHSESIGASQSTSVGAAQSVSVGAAQSISVGANRSVTVKGNEEIGVTGSRSEKVDGGESVTVKSGRAHTVASGNDSLVVAGGDRRVTASSMYMLKADGIMEQAATIVDIDAGTSITIHHGGDSTLVLKAGEATIGTTSKIVLSNPSGTITLADNKVQIGATSEIVLSAGGAKLSLSSDGTVAVSGPASVGLKSGGSTLKLEPATAVVSGSAVNLSASGHMEISGALVKIN